MSDAYRTYRFTAICEDADGDQWIEIVYAYDREDARERIYDRWETNIVSARIVRFTRNA